VKKLALRGAMFLLQELKSASVPSVATVKWRALWLSLARLTRRTGFAMYRTYGFFILYMFMKITLNVYWTTNALLFVPSQLFVIIYVIVSIVNDIVLMYVVCDSAELVKHKVTYRVCCRHCNPFHAESRMPSSGILRYVTPCKN
jgi:hypothetical protein